jgi:AhpD family alkylhydroperoxidase
MSFSHFRKRTYGGPGEFLADLRFIFRNRRRIREATQLIPADLRERLMLAVTQVNGCRYCAQVHARQALAEGVPPEEVEALLAGTVDNCPPEQVTGVLYAQHWADTQGEPDPEARRRLVEAYGEAQAEAIDLHLRVIKSGNYLGNTLDYALYKLSGGRWGK